VFDQLNSIKLQGDKELNQKVLQVIESLANQSEMNKRMLLDNANLQNIIKTQSGISDEKSLINDLDALLKQNQNSSSENQVTVQTPKETSKIVPLNTSQGSPKNIHESSAEKNLPLKKKRFEFGKKPHLEINVSLVNEEQNQTGNEFFD